ncbi:competence type IV pilus assembly protein ComGB [Halobacillus sp. A5]|uniref:competence type IV pilus assembly protein ComGB n=1 Tax=Halobacillus sp. A5 TaxID=2880263 RepID=UPI0020A6C469|nr:competence type IV pilus assembly protein ComGB [Halobacillus sp. A5]MCP3025699.1 type II secretion system F family protein [Halobacillus sp. A5]
MPLAFIKINKGNSPPALPIRNQIVFLNRTCKLLDKGYPLVKSLQMISWDHKYKFITEEIIRELNLGNPIDIAFANANFSRQVTSFLYFARIHQDLPTLFRQCADLLQLQHQYKQKFRDALRYPLILLIFLLAAFTIIKHTIIPSFTTLFDNAAGQPWSLAVLKGSDMIISILGLAFLLFTVMCTAFLLTNHRRSIEQKLAIYEKLPLLRAYKKFTLSFFFATHLSSLLMAGLPLKDALKVISSQSKYPELSYYGNQIQKQLENGYSLSSAIHECPLFRAELTAVFHQTNDLKTLASELQMLAELLIEQLKEKLMKAVQLIQPVFFIIVACLVTLIYASIMLPLYQWMDQI